MLSQFVSGRFVTASIALMAMFLFPALARADGLYADVHGGAPLFGDDGTTVTNLTSAGCLLPSMRSSNRIARYAGQAAAHENLGLITSSVPFYHRS
jgi:hypothetical protein